MSPENITAEDFARYLWELCRKISKDCYLSFKPLVKQYWGELTTDAEMVFCREMIIINLWTISNALREDKATLKCLERIYISGHANYGKTEKEKTDFQKCAEKELKDRWFTYHAAWDNESGGNQSVLAITMLELLLNSGKPDRKCVTAALTNPLIAHILSVIKTAKDCRGEFIIT